MKKQIAILMAAATAVTTIAPVVASADVNDYNASVSEVTAKIKEALKTRYKNKTEDGINASNANDVDDYLNSRYAVVVQSKKIKNDKTDLEDNGLVAYSDTIYDKNNAGNKNQSGKVTNALSENDVFGDANGNLQENNLYVVKNASKFENVLENLVIGDNDNDVKVAIVDKGIKNGSAVETITEKHYVVGYEKNFDKDTEVSLNNLVYGLVDDMKASATYVDTLKVDLGKGEKEVVYDNGNLTIGGQTMTLQGDAEADKDPAKGNVTINVAGENVDVKKVKLTLESGREYTLEANDKAFDLDSPIDKDKNPVTITDANQQSVYKDIEGFKYLENDENKKATIVLPCGDTDVYDLKDVESSTIELGKIFTTKDGYTKEGADLINGIINARNYKNNSLEFNYRGVNYTLANPEKENNTHLITPPKKGNQTDSQYLEAVRNATKVAVAEQPKNAIEKSGDGYVLRYNVCVVNSSDTEVTPTILQFVIKGDSQKDLATVLKDIKGENTIVSGHFTRLEGATRYETAIEVSKENFDPQTASTVVIVGGDAIMDGLSAVPLASIKNAPILLSSKDGLSDATLNEISRACKDLYRKTVYIVGGENSVPKKVVKQLEERFGVVVMRVAGSDRYDTSLEVAKRLNYDGQMNRDIYLVGGEGAVDAMAVSPVAATIKDESNKEVSPVLVVPKKAIKRSTRDFITKKVQFKNGYIIGGEATVSYNVYRDINNAGNKQITLTRISGVDRYDTNVEILKRFYTNKVEETKTYPSKILVKGAIFTSGDTNFLVDTQTAGPLAVSKQAPIVLTGNKLTDDQLKLLKKNGLLHDVDTNVYQVGGVVSSDVMSVVVDKLGL